jgi:hypothetical protein
MIGGNKIVTYGNSSVTYGNKIVTYGNSSVTYGNKIVTYGNKIVTYGNSIMIDRSPINTDIYNEKQILQIHTKPPRPDHFQTRRD